jgi:hypothetical protein
MGAGVVGNQRHDLSVHEFPTLASHILPLAIIGSGLLASPPADIYSILDSRPHNFKTAPGVRSARRRAKLAMKKLLSVLAAATLIVACEQRTETAAPAASPAETTESTTTLTTDEKQVAELTAKAEAGDAESDAFRAWQLGCSSLVLVFSGTGPTLQHSLLLAVALHRREWSGNSYPHPVGQRTYISYGKKK